MMTVWMYEDVKVAFSPPAGRVMVMSAAAIRGEPEQSKAGAWGWRGENVWGGGWGGCINEQVNVRKLKPRGLVVTVPYLTKPLQCETCPKADRDIKEQTNNH